jgi:hypothetical protein
VWHERVGVHHDDIKQTCIASWHIVGAILAMPPHIIHLAGELHSTRRLRQGRAENMATLSATAAGLEGTDGKSCNNAQHNHAAEHTHVHETDACGAELWPLCPVYWSAHSKNKQ